MFLRLTCLTFLIACCTLTCAQDSPGKPAKPDEPPTSDKTNNSDKPKDKPNGPHSESEHAAERETRDIFFRTLNETRSRGAQEFSYLLFQESVRKEIGLSDENAKQAREVLSQSRVSAEKLYEQLKAKSISTDELKVKMQELMTSADRDIWKALGATDKRDRLVGLFVQHRHCSSVLNRIVAEKVGLDESQREEIIRKKETEERKMFEELSRDANSPSDRFRAWEKVQKKIDVIVSEMLTPEQRQNLEKLKGEPFAFEEFPMPPGRGKDGRRGRRDTEKDEKCRECDKLATD